MFVAGLSTSKEYYQIFLRLLFVSGLMFGAVPSFGGAEEGGSVQVTQSFGLKRLNYLDGRICLLYTSPSPRDRQKSRMPSSA